MPRVLLVVALALASAACIPLRLVGNDFPDFVAERPGLTDLRTIGRSARYRLTSVNDQQGFVVTYREPIFAAYWVPAVEMLDATLRSRDVQAAFEGLTPVEPGAETDAMLLTFELLDVRLEGLEATLSIHVTATESGDVLLDRVYDAGGAPYGLEQDGIGDAPLTNTLQLAVKLALDDVMTRLTDDLARARSATRWRPSSWGAASSSRTCC